MKKRLKVFAKTLASLFVFFFVTSDIEAQIKGIITTVAGTGTKHAGSGYSGDGGPATSADFGDPFGIAVDGQGNLYIADYSRNVVRKVDGVTGIITTFAGTGTAGHSGDGGPANAAQLNTPFKLRVFGGGDTAGLYITEFYDVRKVSLSTGIITTVAGKGMTGGYSGDGGLATDATFNGAQSLAFDNSGNMFIINSANIGDTNTHIRKVDAATGVITAFAGSGMPGYSGDGGPANSAKLDPYFGLTIDASNNIYFCDGYGLGTLGIMIRKINGTTGIISTIAGTNDSVGFKGDGGPAVNAFFNNAHSVVADVSGNLYIADGSNFRVRYIDMSSGKISTIAGNGSFSSAGDGGLASLASLAFPQDLCFDKFGNLYILEQYKVRKITAGTAVNNVRMEAEIGLYPNPTPGLLNLTLPAAVKSAAVSIYNMVGQQVVSTVCDGTQTSMNMSSQPAGVYYVRITVGDEVVVRKVVKE